MVEYSIWVIEYARALEYPVSGIVYGAHNAGTRVLPYCYVLMRSSDNIVLVDTGFNYAKYGKDLADSYGITNWQPPRVLLPRVGVTPEDVDTVIITHNHFDHAGDVEAFPNARVVVQRREVENWLSVLCVPQRMRWLTTGLDPDDLFALLEVARQGRLDLVDGPADVLPGVSVRPAFDTHTAGSQYVVVTAPGGPWVLAGDAVYVYENLVGIRGDGVMVPVGFATGSQERCIHVMGEIMDQVMGDTRRVVPVHEVALWERFPSVEYNDGLHIAEITRIAGEMTKLLVPGGS